MNTQHILQALKGKLNHNTIHFLGCLSADELPKLNLRDKDGKPLAFIVNVLTSNQKHIMGHWVCVYTIGKCLCYLDSYALEPRLYSRYFVDFFDRYKDFTLLQFKHRLQSDTSLVCGLYCIQFVVLCNHWGIIKASDFFRNNYQTCNYLMNDKNVLRFAYKYFKLPPCIATFSKNAMTFNTCKAIMSTKR